MKSYTSMAINVLGEPNLLAGDIVLSMGPGARDWRAQLGGQGQIIRAYFKRLGIPQRRAVMLWNAMHAGKVNETRAAHRMESIASDALNVLACNSVEVTWFFPEDIPSNGRLEWEKKKKPTKKKKPRKPKAKRKDAFLRSTDFRDD